MQNLYLNRLQQGFTLIEILIALTIFAILATITSSAMYYAFDTRARVNEQTQRLNSLALAISIIDRDTKQIILREVRGDNMQIYPAFMGEKYSLEFTRTGIVNPNSEEKRSIEKRVALFCKEGKLIQRLWNSLDTTNRSFYQDKTLISGLKDCQFAYLNHNLQVLSEWHAHALQQNQKDEPLPTALRLDLKFSNEDKMNRLFIIPPGLYALV